MCASGAKFGHARFCWPGLQIQHKFVTEAPPGNAVTNSGFSFLRGKTLKIRDRSCDRTLSPRVFCIFSFSQRPLFVQFFYLPLPRFRASVLPPHPPSHCFHALISSPQRCLCVRRCLHCCLSFASMPRIRHVHACLPRAHRLPSLLLTLVRVHACTSVLASAS